MALSEVQLSVVPYVKPELRNAMITSLPDLPRGKSTCLYTTLQGGRKRSGLSGFDRTTFSLKQK